MFKTTGQKLILQERDAPPYGTEQKDILSRLQIAESSLKAIQAEYQQVLNHESHGIRIINKDFTIRLINRCFAEMTGVRPEEATGRKCYDFFASPFCQTSNCRLKLVLRGASSLQAEMERTKPDGEKIPCLVSASPFRNENGKIAGVIETFSDITERQKLEKEILESEERYRALVELGTEVGEAIVMLQDMDGVEGAMVFMSEQWPKMTGYSRDELLRLTFFDLLHPRDKSASLERHRTKMLGKKIPGLYEMTVIRKDGKEVPVELTGAYTSYHGHIVNVIYVRDTTERKEAEKRMRQIESEIRESEERYRSLFDDIPVAIYEMDYSDVRARIEQIRLKGITDFETYFNDNWDEFVNCFNLRKVIGQNNAVVTTLKAQNKEHVEKCIQKFLEERPTGLRRDLENLLALIKGEQKIIYQTYQPDFQGGWQYLNVYFVLAPGHEQDWSRVFLSFWDVTEQVNAENQLKKYQAQLEEMVNERTIQLSYEVEKRKEAEAVLKDLYSQELALRKRLEEQNKQRTEFTRALVHEIKTPLTSVMAASELLLSEFHDEPQCTLAKHIFEGSIELNARTDELFDMAKGELGILKLKKGDVDPVVLIRDVLVTVEPAVKEKRQRLIRKGCWSLPKIWADETRLRQVLLNILNNAIKYTPIGGMISVTATNPEAKLHIKISDNGPGISTQDQKWVFEPYHRLKEDGSFSGLGLGLSISKTLVELHEGAIWVESDGVRGTTIHISLPLKESVHQQDNI